MSRPRRRPPLSKLTLSITKSVKSKAIKKSKASRRPLTYVVEDFLEGWCEGIYTLQSTDKK